MSEEEFDAFVLLIAGGDPVTNVRTGVRMRPEDVDAFRKAKHVPMVARGTKTEYLFKHCEVDTDLMSVIVRGTGERLFGRTFGN